MTNQEHVDETLVVRHHHIWIAFVLGQFTARMKLPKWVEPLVYNTKSTKGVASRVTTFIEGHRRNPDKKDQRCPDDDNDTEGEPAPKTQNASFQHISCSHMKRCHKVVL